MNDNVKLLLEILRNPVNQEKDLNYLQTAGFLRKGDCYCAGGVICDILTKKEPQKYRWEPLKESVSDLYEFVITGGPVVDNDGEFRCYINMPQWTLENFGLKPYMQSNEDVAKLLEDKGHNKLSKLEYHEIWVLNDNDVDWDTIAQIIEITYPAEKE